MPVVYQLPAERPGLAANADLSARREALAAAAAAGMWRTDPAPEERLVNGVRTLFFHPPGQSRGTILHLHGGAFRIGAPIMMGPFANALAKDCGMTVVCPAYRLAPEYPFPAGLNDSRAILTKLQADELPIIISGDSAGGGLAAGLAMLAVQNKVPLTGLVLLSAWLDLTVTSASFAANGASDPLFSTAAAQEAAALYLQGLSPNDPLASPIFGDAAGLPPCFISVGAGEVLADDARKFHQLLQEAGTPSTLSVIEGMEHVAVTRDAGLPGAAETFTQITRFISSLFPA